MISIRHAHRLRREMESLSAALPDETALEVPEMFPIWKPGAYSIGDRVRHDGVLYKCVQDHPSNGTYTPDVAVSLWARVLIPSGIPEWVQPESTNPYMRGDKVRHFEKVWESQIDYNVYEPGTVGTENLWLEVSA